MDTYRINAKGIKVPIKNRDKELEKQASTPGIVSVESVEHPDEKGGVHPEPGDEASLSLTPRKISNNNDLESQLSPKPDVKKELENNGGSKIALKTEHPRIVKKIIKKKVTDQKAGSPTGPVPTFDTVSLPQKTEHREALQAISQSLGEIVTAEVPSGQLDPDTGRLVWRPNPGAQEEALRHTEFEILYGGARGGGKTDAGLVWMTDHVDNPRYRGLVIRKNADDLSDWVDRATRMYSGFGAVFTGQPKVITFPSGAIIKTGHLKDDDAYTKYQGHEYHRLLIEELTQIPSQKRYLQLLSSCRSTVVGIKPKVFLTTNPGGVGHSWVKKRFRTDEPNRKIIDEETGLSRIFIPALVEDNPILMERDPNYVKVIDMLKSSDLQQWKAWRLGDWSVFIGQFFGEFRPERHVVDTFQVPNAWKKWFGYDMGFANPMACYWMALDWDGRVWVYRELYGEGKTEETQADEIMTLQQNEDVDYGLVDPSIFAKVRQGQSQMTQSVADTFIKKGLNIQPANNNRIQGWTRVRSYMEEMPACQMHRAMGWETCPRIHIMSNCDNLIRTIPDMVYDEKNTEDMDTTTEDHACDALRYGLMGAPEVADKDYESQIRKMQQLAIAGMLM